MTKSLRNHKASSPKPSTNTNISIHENVISHWLWQKSTFDRHSVNKLCDSIQSSYQDSWSDLLLCMIHTQFAVVIRASFVPISASLVTPQSHPCIFCSRALRLLLHHHLLLLYFLRCFSSVTSYTSVALARLQYYTAAFLLLLRWSAILPDSAVVSLDPLSACPLPDAKTTRIAPIPVTPTGKAYVDPELLSCVS